MANDADELVRQIALAQVEAKAAFGDGSVYLERFIRHARHIEVQVLGDGRDVIHCWERECSLQRRRQKILEEAPSPALSQATRERLCTSAVALAKAVAYRSAGTLEYLYDDRTGEFFFIEMYPLVQVALNDLIMLVAFAPIVIFLLGVSNITVPYDVLVYSVVLYIVIPLGAGALSRTVLLRSRGPAWFEGVFLPRLKPASITALLATLVLIFAFQGEIILGKLSDIVLIAIPLLIQVYFNSGLAYGLARWLRVPHAVVAPGALIGASNFFVLGVGTAISLFGLTSGATLARVVGVLVEVPVMVSVCSFCNRTRHWFAGVDEEPAPATIPAKAGR